MPWRGVSGVARKGTDVRRPVSISQHVYQVLRERIIAGELKPGSRLDPAQLAEEFGVSVTPVREAIVSLGTEGLVDIVPHRHVLVSFLSFDDLVDLYKVRRMVERLACPFIMENISDEEIKHIESLLRQSQKMAKQGKMLDADRLNREFHNRLYQCIQNKYLTGILYDLMEKSRRYVGRAAWVKQRIHCYLKNHEMIVEALKKRDLESFTAAAEKDIADTIEFCTLYLDMIKETEKIAE